MEEEPKSYKMPSLCLKLVILSMWTLLCSTSLNLSTSPQLALHKLERQTTGSQTALIERGAEIEGVRHVKSCN